MSGYNPPIILKKLILLPRVLVIRLQKVCIDSVKMTASANLSEIKTKSLFQVNLEIASLPIEERKKAWRDLHCQAAPEDEIEETPEFRAEKLHELEETIDTIIASSQDKTRPTSSSTNCTTEAYELAQFVNPEYVNSDEFRLMFLRADRYDVTKAANRLFTYWNRKVDLVGTDKAFRPLSPFLFDFVDPAFQHAMNLGGIRLLPYFDQAGRIILFSYRQYWYEEGGDEGEVNDVMLKAIWTMVHLAVTDPDHGEYIQRNGMVILAARGDIPPGKKEDTVLHKANKMKMKWHDLIKALPLQLVCTHHVAPGQVDQIQAAIQFMFSNVFLRARYRQYTGSPEENIKALKKCGIPPDAVPTELGGELHFNYTEWLCDQLAFEEDTSGEMPSEENDTDDSMFVDEFDYDEEIEIYT